MWTIGNEIRRGSAERASHATRSLVGATVLLTSALAGALSCGGDTTKGDGDTPESPARAFPEGTVMTIGGLPVTAEDIDHYLPLIEIVEPEFVENDKRRKIFANIVLPRFAASALLPDEREAAFREAQRWHVAARETGSLPEDAAEPSYLSGYWLDVGFVLWDEARSTPVGSYSRLFESAGTWTFFKLVATDVPEGAEFGPRTQITVQRYDVPFLDAEAMPDIIAEGMNSLPVEIIDPEWESVVPPVHLYRSREE